MNIRISIKNKGGNKMDFLKKWINVIIEIIIILNIIISFCFNNIIVTYFAVLAFLVFTLGLLTRTVKHKTIFIAVVALIILIAFLVLLYIDKGGC